VKPGRRAVARRPVRGGPPLSTALIAGLSAAIIFLGKKWLDARAENAELRASVAQLKRRLKLGAG
jgi:hypothetical protein